MGGGEGVVVGGLGVASWGGLLASGCGLGW